MTCQPSCQKGWLHTALSRMMTRLQFWCSICMILEFVSAPGRRLEVRRITDVEQLDDVLSVEEQVNGGDFRWLKQRMMPHFEIPGYLSVYVGYLEGRPVSTGWIYFHPGSQFAGLFGGATLAEFRGQGWYAAILQRRIWKRLSGAGILWSSAQVR